MNNTHLMFLSGMLSAFSASGQSSVAFDMSAAGTTVNGGMGVRAYDLDGVTRIAGTSFLAQLWSTYGLDRPESELVPVGKPVFMRTGDRAGWNQVSGIGPDGLQVYYIVQAFPTSGPDSYRTGGPATVQVRVWENLNLVSYDDIATSRLGKYGKSPLLNLYGTGNPPGIANRLGGLQSFALIPEPSTLALGLIAGAALLWRRRK